MPKPRIQKPLVKVGRTVRPYHKARPKTAEPVTSELPVAVPERLDFRQNSHTLKAHGVFKGARVMRAGGGPEQTGHNQCAYQHTDRHPDTGANPEIVLEKFMAG